MDCSEFMTRFSDYYDRRSDDRLAEEMESHLASCGSCRRYHGVVTRGGQLLRALPRPTPRHDFRPRLQHRIYHVEDEAALGRSASSGTTGTTALVMAVLLTMAAWTPVVTDGPPSAPVPFTPLSSDAVDPPSPEPAATTLQPAFAGPGALFQEPPARPAESGLVTRKLWVDSHSLLYEYSTLSEKYRQAAVLRRTGLD